MLNKVTRRSFVWCLQVSSSLRVFSWMIKLTKTQILSNGQIPNCCSVFGFNYFWVSFSRERKYERIERKSKAQNPNLVQKWRRHSRIVVHQFRRQGYYSGRMVFSSWNRKKRDYLGRILITYHIYWFWPLIGNDNVTQNLHSHCYITFF